MKGLHHPRVTRPGHPPSGDVLIQPDNIQLGAHLSYRSEKGEMRDSLHPPNRVGWTIINGTLAARSTSPSGNPGRQLYGVDEEATGRDFLPAPRGIVRTSRRVLRFGKQQTERLSLNSSSTQWLATGRSLSFWCFVVSTI